MADQVIVFLRNSDVDLASAFLNSLNLPVVLFPRTSKDREQAIRSYLADHIFPNDGLIAKLKYEVNRVECLNKSQYDLYFNQHCPVENPDTFRCLNTRDRAIWLFVHSKDDFEDIERQLSYDTLSGQKTKSTRFDTAADKPIDFSMNLITTLENEVRNIFLGHDGSGKFINSFVPSENFNEETLSMQISRAPEVLETFEEDGSTIDETVRKITDVHFRYTRSNGLLMIATSRGGYKIRQQLSEAFAKLILQVDDLPSVSEVEKLELQQVLTFETPPLIPGQPDAEILLVEANVRTWSLSGHHFKVVANGGLNDTALKRITNGDLSSLVILSLVFRISNYRPEGASKPCKLRVELHQDGSVHCNSLKAEQERLMLLLPKMYGLSPSVKANA